MNSFLNLINRDKICLCKESSSIEASNKAPLKATFVYDALCLFFLDDDNIERPHLSKYDMTMGELTT